MPELPEVQTVVNGIKSKLIGLKIKDTEAVSYTHLRAHETDS